MVHLLNPNLIILLWSLLVWVAPCIADDLTPKDSSAKFRPKEPYGMCDSTATTQFTISAQEQAYSYFQAGKYKDAEKLYLIDIKAHPNSDEAASCYYTLCSIYDALHLQAKADQCVDCAIAIQRQRQDSLELVHLLEYKAWRKSVHGQSDQARILLEECRVILQHAKGATGSDILRLDDSFRLLEQNIQLNKAWDRMKSGDGTPRLEMDLQWRKSSPIPESKK